MTLRWRVTLRARIAATVAVAVLGSTVVVTYAAYELERSGTETRFIAAARAGTDSDLQQAAVAVKHHGAQTPADALVSYAQGRGGIYWAVVRRTNTPSLLEALSWEGASPDDLPDLTRQLLAEGAGLDSWTTVAGTRMYVAGGSVSDDLSLVELYDFTPVQHQLDRLRSDLIRLDLAGLAVALVLAVLVATRISRPVRRAADVARRFGDGELQARMPVHGHDELADLAEAFNRMAARLADTMNALHRSQEQQRRFVADVSHELRTPIAAMLAVADSLDSTDVPTRNRAAALLGEQIRRARQLTEDLLEISRFDAGRASLELENVDVPALVADVIATVAADSDVRVHTVGDLTLWADARRLHTVLRNLVGNAVQHGTPPVHVEIDGRADQVLAISVEDAGPGIDPQLQSIAFDRFVRADTARGGGGGSSGLGLSIALENAKLHGATLYAVGGSRFTLTMPRRRPARELEYTTARVHADPG